MCLFIIIVAYLRLSLEENIVILTFICTAWSCFIILFFLIRTDEWCGVLGSFHTNNEAVGVQLFRKFITKQQVSHLEWPDMPLSQDLKPLIDELHRVRENAYFGGFFYHIVTPFELTTMESYYHQLNRKDSFLLMLA